MAQAGGCRCQAGTPARGLQKAPCRVGRGTVAPPCGGLQHHSSGAWAWFPSPSLGDLVGGSHPGLRVTRSQLPLAPLILWRVVTDHRKVDMAEPWGTGGSPWSVGTHLLPSLGNPIGQPEEARLGRTRRAHRPRWNQESGAVPVLEPPGTLDRSGTRPPPDVL